MPKASPAGADSSTSSAASSSNSSSRPPTLLLLCGLPGCGKSTFSTAFATDPGDAARKTPAWLRVSPDDVGSMDDCKKLIAKQLKARGCVVVDRCNASHKERQMFVREAQEFAPVNVEVVYFRVPPDVCIARAKARRGHPTLDPNEAEKVITQFAATFRPVDNPKEGPYSAVYTVDEGTPPATMRQLVKHYLNTAIHGPSPFIVPTADGDAP